MAGAQVLLRGCRCIEIDVWDGEPSDSGSSHHDSPGAVENSKLDKLKYGGAAISSRFGQAKAKVKEQYETRWGGRNDASPGAMDKLAEGELAIQTRQISPSATSKVEPRVLHGHTLT